MNYSFCASFTGNSPPHSDYSTFHGMNPNFFKNVLLLLLVNFVSGVRVELVYISLIVNTRSSLSHLHAFQLLVP